MRLSWSEMGCVLSVGLVGLVANLAACDDGGSSAVDMAEDTRRFVFRDVGQGDSGSDQTRATDASSPADGTGASDSSLDPDTAPDTRPDTRLADFGPSDTGQAIDTADTGTIEPQMDVSFDLRPPDVGVADSADGALADTSEMVDGDTADISTPPASIPGSYSYSRLAIGGLDDSVEVVAHPDGSYFIIAERSSQIHVVDAATGTATAYDFWTGTGTFYVEDLDFDPSGDFALISGTVLGGTDDVGSIIRLDDAELRAANTTAIFREVANLPVGHAVAAIDYPADGTDPAVLVRNDPPGSGYNFILHRLDPVAETFTQIDASFSGSGCDDIAFADNEFGTWGIFIACGINGADTFYHTEVGGVAELRDGQAMGNNNLGNTSFADSYESQYSLVVSWSGRAVYRFEAGLLNGYSDAARFSTRGIRGVKFQPGGERALVYGRAGGNPLVGTVIEYRHDYFPCVSPFSNCEWTDVSIPDFETLYLAGSNTYLHSAAWRPGCDGGVIVGGDSNRGIAATFQLDGGVPCW